VKVQRNTAVLCQTTHNVQPEIRVIGFKVLERLVVLKGVEFNLDNLSSDFGVFGVKSLAKGES